MKPAVSPQATRRRVVAFSLSGKSRSLHTPARPRPAAYAPLMRLGGPVKLRGTEFRPVGGISRGLPAGELLAAPHDGVSGVLVVERFAGDDATVVAHGPGNIPEKRPSTFQPG